MELSILNAGRGAGKTYTLVKWARENPKRIVVGYDVTKDAMTGAGIPQQFLHYSHLVVGRASFPEQENLEVAFDDFTKFLDWMLEDRLGLPSDSGNSAILAINIPESELLPRPSVDPDFAARVKAAKNLGPEERVKAVHSFLSHLENVAKNVVGQIDGTAAEFLASQKEPTKNCWDPREWREENGFEDKPKDREVTFRDLRLGDYVVGRGQVRALRIVREFSSAAGTIFDIEVDLMAEDFEGTMRGTNTSKVLIRA